MNALQQITSALELNEQSSMLELQQAKTNLSRLADIVTSDLAVRGHEQAEKHVRELLNKQESKIDNGEVVRII